MPTKKKTTKKAAPRKPTVKQVLKDTLAAANASNNQYDRTEAKIDAVAAFILGQ